MNSIVMVEHLSKTLGDIKVIDDVSFDVKKGEFVAIQGPSGSGKTTLLALVAGLPSPFPGKCTCQGDVRSVY